MGNGPVGICSRALGCDPEYEWEDDYDDKKPKAADPEPAPDPGRPQLALRVAYAPIEDSLGARKSPFALGDEIAVMKILKAAGWEPMSWRQERAATQLAKGDSSNTICPGPEESRFARAQRFWAAKVVASDGKGGFEDFWCLLQVAAKKEERNMDNVKEIVSDAADTAAYAHRFNQHTAKAVGEDPNNVPSVRVAAPVACQVIDSATPEIASAGDAIALTFYPSNNITKFVFEGGEDFLELPQAFFHFVVWTSGGKELIGDLQGVQDEQDIFLIDPVVIKQPQMGVNDLLGMMADPSAANSLSPNEQRFNLWHPRCAQLCRSFDPQRRGAHVRRACGVALPTCGVGGA